jgi:hypothetical protein
MKTRPTSITVVSWILIVIGLVSLVASTASLDNPMTKELMSRSPIPIPLQYIMMYFGLLAQIASGFAMLKRKNWGRLLYPIWGAIGLVIGLITSPIKLMLIPGVVFFAVVVFFLFRPNANEYFKLSDTKGEPQDA